MNNKPLVSVIMNCYNSDTYLKEAIESVINQTYQNWEVVFWDNQSTDRSAEIINSYNDKRIRYFYAPSHTSLGEGRNLALEKINGRYVSFLDCDDWWICDKIEKTLKCFDSYEVGIVHTNGSQFFQETGVYKIFHKGVQPTGYIFEEMIANYNIALVSAMFRVEVLNDLVYYFDPEFSMIEEFDFFIRIAKNWKVNYCTEQLCFWRAHKSSLTWTKKDKTKKEFEKFVKKILQFSPDLQNKKCIKRIEAKIMYYEFFNKWKDDKVADRSLLFPYLLIDKRLLAIYIFSFFGWKIYNAILKYFGKSI